MCAVIGFYSSDVSEQERLLLSEVFIQSGIRGKHATGLFWGGGYVSEPVNVYDFVELFPFEEITGETYLIGHTRYSTSDLDYNQPILCNEGVSVVHNGVITQETPEKWVKHFGYSCETRNDSELILRAYINGHHPIERFKGSSISCIISDGRFLKFFRNSSRPLWFIKYGGSYFISSTKDILIRSFGKFGINIEPINCEPGVEYYITGGVLTKRSGMRIDYDWQCSLDCATNYKSLANGL